MAKKKRTRKSLPARQGVRTTAERRQHMGGIVTEVIDRDLRGNPYMVRDRAAVGCVLDAYLLRELISPQEFEAGMKFRKAYLRAVYRVRVDDPLSGGVYDPEMAFVMIPYSEQLLRDAYEALSDAQERVVISVCGADEWAGNTARIKTLHRGLEKLVELWKI